MTRPYDLDPGVESRAITFENPTGERGAGGRAASPLGVGRKGAPARLIEPGETVRLCDIEGPGTIRHIWATTLAVPAVLRSFVVRGYWEGQAHPSIEAPLGDFAGFAHGKPTELQTMAHSVGRNAALNVWIEMPFVERARFEITNEGAHAMPLFYQIDYTVGDRHADDVGRLHVLFRRQNPTTLTEDFEILPERRGRGSYLGAVIGVRVTDPRWWGEGEVKMYLDGDAQFATIVGTGSEDYVGLSFGMQETAHLLHGASLDRDAEGGHWTSMYRWHFRDPVYWRESIRITIQQIGHLGEARGWENYPSQLYERRDDWSTATFWYEAIPSAPLPPMPDVAERTADLFPEIDEPWRALWEALERRLDGE
jgi:hypothetical protein